MDHCLMMATPRASPRQKKYIPRTSMSPRRTDFHHLLDMNPSNTLSSLFLYRARDMSQQREVSPQTMMGLYQEVTASATEVVAVKGGEYSASCPQIQTRRTKWKEWMEEQPEAWGGSVAGWDGCCRLQHMHLRVSLTSRNRVNCVRSFMIWRVMATKRYQNGISDGESVRMVPYQSPSRKRGSCRQRMEVQEMSQYEQQRRDRSASMKRGKRQQQVDWLMSALWMAGRRRKPSAMTPTMEKTNSTLILCFQLNETTARQQMRMPGQVRTSSVRKQLLRVSGSAISTRELESRQGSMETARARMKMRAKQGNQAS